MVGTAAAETQHFDSLRLQGLHHPEAVGVGSQVELWLVENFSFSW